MEEVKGFQEHKVMVLEDIFTIKDVGSPDFEDFKAQVNEYLSVFAICTEKGAGHCIKCGGKWDGFKQALGLGPAVEWLITHGEGRCTGCGWPARGMHYPKDKKDDSELFSLRNFFMSYHPSQLTPKG